MLTNQAISGSGGPVEASRSDDSAVADVVPMKLGKLLPRGWKRRYVALVRKTGNLHRNARRVGVSFRTVQRHRLKDPKFNQAIELAIQVACDRWEDALTAQAEKTGNPVGHIVRLKAKRPSEYIEKH